MLEKVKGVTRARLNSADAVEGLPTREPDGLVVSNHGGRQLDGAANGEAGVARMLRLLEAEMRIAMALAGTVWVADINANMDARRNAIQRK
jgi:isopentenyl diphosphate isomerase/L-lactate dehydrogenase-like FMN-dependent dehydrogenase